MATAPKSSTTTKKASSKKAPSKGKQGRALSPSSKKATSKKDSAVRSFRLTPETQAFTTFRITRQTIYWIILAAFIIFVQLWILKLQIEVATLLDNQAMQLNQ